MSLLPHRRRESCLRTGMPVRRSLCSDDLRAFCDVCACMVPTEQSDTDPWLRRLVPHTASSPLEVRGSL